ncbi:helix-turn-helix domain-containing protein [Listeria fleischmannii]|uniref:helix-turn-helix domain-containing protein n=1 Tax=Listeria fleischmannii TaxID=1069827 RepID=UPI000254F65F|nr:helix-turn-helix domain-containing protein [Listeria fleischmannii]EIA20113.1 transcriptional regulator [Listeria fleischmannii subsp. coloradonensis]STY34407.1 Anthrax toxin expression trans-acting positive regulator [Listeria fleischmannii subsp. coloradonensis]
MRSLLEKTTRRRMELLEILSADNRWYKLEDLAEKLDCSKRTLNNDIAVIQGDLMEGWLLITSRKLGIQMQTPDNAHVDKLYQYFMQHSMSIKLLLGTFYSQNRTVEEWADELFTSPSSLYRLIHRIRKKMAVYGVTLNINPVYVTGKESQVRYFFSQLFYTTFGIDKWPFQADDREAIDRYIATQESIVGYRFVYPHRQERFVWLQVSLERIRQGYFIDMAEIAVPFYERKAELQNSFKQLEKDTGVVLNEGERYGIKLLQLQGLGYEKDANIQASLTFFKSCVPSKLAQAEELLDDIVTLYNHAYPPNKDEILLQLLSYLLYLEQFVEFDSFIVSKRGYVTNVLNKEFPIFCEAVRKAVNDMKIANLKAETVIFFLGTLWKGLAEETRKEIEPVRILVASQLSVSNTRFLKSIVASRFQNQVMLFEMKEANLNEEDLLAKKIDFILADFATKNYTSVPTVEVNYFPSERDWRNIRKKIHSVQKEKMAHDE